MLNQLSIGSVRNGTGRLTEATRQRVLAAARDLMYVQPATARAAAHGRTGVLGLTMAGFGDAPVSYTEIPYYADILLSAVAAATDRGHLLLVLPSSAPAWTWLGVPLDGVVHLDPRADDPVMAVLRARDLPVVGVGAPPAAASVDAWVDVDVAAATVTLLDHLARAGARRIGLVLPRHGAAYPAQVEAAYGQWCDAGGRPPAIASFDPMTRYPQAERAAAARLLGAADRPDALVGLYADSGVHLLAAAAARGLEVPADLLVASLNDDPVNGTTSPPVTGVDQRPRELGAQAVDLLVALVNRRRGVRRTRLVEPALVVRGSTAPPSAVRRRRRAAAP